MPFCLTCGAEWPAKHFRANPTHRARAAQSPTPAPLDAEPLASDESEPPSGSAGRWGWLFWLFVAVTVILPLVGNLYALAAPVRTASGSARSQSAPPPDASRAAGI